MGDNNNSTVETVYMTNVEQGKKAPDLVTATTLSLPNCKELFIASIADLTLTSYVGDTPEKLYWIDGYGIRWYYWRASNVKSGSVRGRIIFAKAIY